MSTNNPHKDKIIKAAQKLIEQKDVAIAYSKGEISKKELSDRGFKLTFPL